MDIKKMRIILWSMVALAGIVFITTYQMQSQTAGKAPTVVVKNFGGDFELTNHLGEAVTQDNFKNKNRLIYFGFTYCPAICPTELQRMASVINQLENIGNNIEPIFITVDPERDTVEVMRDYV